MARRRFVCDSLCAYFLLFHGISLVLSINDNYYLYNTESSHHRSEYSVVIENEDLHQFQKRNVQQDITSTNDNQTISNSPPTSLPNNTADIPSKTKPGKLSKPTQNGAKVLLNLKEQTLTKNLGVNGTGQRKNVASTLKPILLTNNSNQSSTVTSVLRDSLKTNTITKDNATTTSTTVAQTTLTNSNTSTNGVNSNNSTISGEDDVDGEDVISISKFSSPNDDFNNTLSKHNITSSKTDGHVYYNSTIDTSPAQGHYYWVNLTNRSDVKVNELLSRSHRRAATIKLSFEFPFYGHLIKNVTIATGGFLYTGEYVHSWLAATQYIAPLMANFDTSLSNNSYIRYVDNGTAFTVEWDRVTLQDKPMEGEFTFQVTLHKSGDIVFVYQTVPLFIESIDDDHHPVKVGLSDAYIIDRTVFFVRRKTIYEYHRVNFDKDDIKNWTVIYLRALPTCLENKDCYTCLTRQIAAFKCMWCPTTNSCSNGFDRNRQEWLMRNCEKKQFNNESLCSNITSSEIFDENITTYEHDAKKFEHVQEDRSKYASRVYHNHDDVRSGGGQPVKMGVSSIVAILFLIAMVSGLTMWILYAYRNPHTTSGQILIRYRPSQWRWRRGEARYTAATIHM